MFINATHLAVYLTPLGLIEMHDYLNLKQGLTQNVNWNDALQAKNWYTNNNVEILC